MLDNNTVYFNGSNMVKRSKNSSANTPSWVRLNSASMETDPTLWGSKPLNRASISSSVSLSLNMRFISAKSSIPSCFNSLVATRFNVVSLWSAPSDSVGWMMSSICMFKISNGRFVLSSASCSSVRLHAPITSSCMQVTGVKRDLSTTNGLLYNKLLGTAMRYFWETASGSNSTPFAMRSCTMRMAMSRGSQEPSGKAGPEKSMLSISKRPELESTFCSRPSNK
mmetsp:Transcript_105014/g.301925  ORF Transcript_105014/g.301925 Transcript_105014/m.301925 type:complete len:224 (-) Transcript_105014:917-1588(-)